MSARLRGAKFAIRPMMTCLARFIVLDGSYLRTALSTNLGLGPVDFVFRRVLGVRNVGHAPFGFGPRVLGPDSNPMA